MKFIVPTHMRVGSTWVCKALGLLLEEKKRYDFCDDRDHILGRRATDEELKPFRKSKSRVIKTHDFAPSDLLPLLADEDTYIVSVRRNFNDSLLSYLLYEKDVIPREGHEQQPKIKSLLERHPDITDAAYVNLYIETQQPDILKHLKRWLLSSHIVVHQDVIVVDYDVIKGSTMELLQLLNTKIGRPESVFRDIAKTLTTKAMKKQHTKGFVRKGIVGDHRNYFDPQSIAWINQQRNIISKDIKL